MTLTTTVTSLTFSANGSWETPVVQGCLDEWNTPRGQQTLCIMGNSQAPAGLSAPVVIHPQLPLLPFTPWERAQRCVDRSYDPEWQVNELTYHHHPAQGEDGTRTLYNMTLDLINVSDDENLKCSAAGEFQQDGNHNGSAPWVRCAPEVGTHLTAADAWVDVTLDTSYGVLGVRQAWECFDGVAGVER